MICSSVNLDFFMPDLPLEIGLYSLSCGTENGGQVIHKLHRELRRTRTDYSTICPKQEARYAINRIEQILERDIASQSAIFRAQNELTDLLTDVAFALGNLSAADRGRANVPTKSDIENFLFADLPKLVFVWGVLPPKDKDAIRRAADLRIKPVFNRGAEILRPLLL
jgi:hypothetical protein